MTCNQLMLLLSIYRGTAGHEMKIGTYDHDIDYLTKKRLIVRAFLAGKEGDLARNVVVCHTEGDVWAVTTVGRIYVEECLTLENNC